MRRDVARRWLWFLFGILRAERVLGLSGSSFGVVVVLFCVGFTKILWHHECDCDEGLIANTVAATDSFVVYRCSPQCRVGKFSCHCPEGFSAMISRTATTWSREVSKRLCPVRPLSHTFLCGLNVEQHEWQRPRDSISTSRSFMHSVVCTDCENATRS